MRVYDIISKKRDNKELSKDEIEFFIEKYTNGDIPDYQASALLMAIYINGFSKEETANLTMAMVNSGDVVDLSMIEGIKLDKHSTGGVGDKTSLILVPMVCAAGGKVAKLSGRGLGHTGGTLDKLESIPGFNISVEEEKFKDMVKNATVDSIPLIAASIMSKKIASGSDAILLDVKYGEGAFMKTAEDAKKLATAMVNIGNSLGRKTSAAITLNGEPLGYAIGNALELKEVIEVLKGEGPEDLRELCLQLGAQMLKIGGIEPDTKKGREKLEKVLSDNSALYKLRELAVLQGGDPSVIDNPELFEIAPLTYEVKANKEGYVYDLNAEKVGIASLLTGAGRHTKDDELDYGAGIILKKKMGDYVKEGDVLATLYSSDKDRFEKAEEQLQEAYYIQNEKPEKSFIIHEIIG